LPAPKLIDRVDRPRYMGTGYVIAAIPTFIETEAYNGRGTYQLEADGAIDQRVLTELSAKGYDLSQRRQVPQRWPTQQ
jgi:hypothetical protein